MHNSGATTVSMLTLWSDRKGYGFGQSKDSQAVRERVTFRSRSLVLQDPILIFGSKPVIDQVNDAALKMLKYSHRSEIEGVGKVVKFSPEIQPDGTPTKALMQRMMEGIRRGETVTQEAWHYDKEGNLFPVLVKAKVGAARGRSCVWFQDAMEHQMGGHQVEKCGFCRDKGAARQSQSSN